MGVENVEAIGQSGVDETQRRPPTWACPLNQSNPQGKGKLMPNEANVEKLIADLRVLTRDAEALLHATAGQAGEKIDELRHRLSAALETAKATCQRLEEKAIAGAKVADKTIREHPYESIGVAVGVGFLIGVLASRR
jgi:ElaB/YqjD/DUF883 family membrane-anchored ribosome-binding protein